MVTSKNTKGILVLNWKGVFTCCLQNRNLEIYTEEWTNKRDLNGILDTLLGQKGLVMLVTVELNVGSSYCWYFSNMKAFKD